MRNSPPALFTPFPATLGTQRTVTDTLFEGGDDMEISTRTMNVNGYGILDVLRMVEDEERLSYNGGVFQGRHRGKNITFMTRDISWLSFNVDTNYTRALTLVRSYNYGRTRELLPFPSAERDSGGIWVISKLSQSV
jgi:hypothetical protein